MASAIFCQPFDLAVVLAPSEVALVTLACCSSVSLALTGSGDLNWPLGHGAVQLLVSWQLIKLFQQTQEVVNFL